MTRSNSGDGDSDRNNPSTVSSDRKCDSKILVTTARFYMSNATINRLWQQQQHVGNCKNSGDGDHNSKTLKYIIKLAMKR